MTARSTAVYRRGDRSASSSSGAESSSSRRADVEGAHSGSGTCCHPRVALAEMSNACSPTNNSTPRVRHGLRSSRLSPSCTRVKYFEAGAAVSRESDIATSVQSG